MTDTAPDDMTALLAALRKSVALQLDIDGNAHEITVKATRRHPAEVTADRLAKTMEEYLGSLGIEDGMAMERTVRVLREIASGQR